MTSGFKLQSEVWWWGMATRTSQCAVDDDDVWQREHHDEQLKTGLSQREHSMLDDRNDDSSLPFALHDVSLLPNGQQLKVNWVSNVSLSAV